mmetsp:Transcript_20290/g.64833  ORF Transcript_20290/g.64833 Transcript_20290/m.64833 type:complete len:152 (-) Transcript_20290:136-591(-)
MQALKQSLDWLTSPQEARNLVLRLAQEASEASSSSSIEAWRNVQAAAADAASQQQQLLQAQLRRMTAGLPHGWCVTLSSCGTPCYVSPSNDATWERPADAAAIAAADVAAPAPAQAVHAAPRVEGPPPKRLRRESGGKQKPAERHAPGKQS